MIELKHLGKIYSSASGSVEALKDVNLTIADGEIFGIIGLSGAGKSTIIQLISRFWLDPRFFKSRMFLHYPDTCRLFIDPVCHRAVCVVVK